MKIEISFDDGTIGDLKAAALLKQYGLIGTFYIPSCQLRNTIQLSLKEAKSIADMGMEIGGHTVSHPMDMKLLDDKELDFEIANNAALIEKIITKKPITKFCYPRGRHDERVRNAVKKFGFKEARTTHVLHIKNKMLDPFQTPTTIHMFQRQEYNGEHWYDMAKKMFWIAKKEAEYNPEEVFFSIWGHTKELEEQKDWEKFEDILKLIVDENVK